MRMMQPQIPKSSVQINHEGKVQGEPTPAQQRLLDSLAYQLAHSLYLNALQKGQVTASMRLAELNRMLASADSQEPTQEQSLSY